jgi:hypothetical protein
VGKIHPLEDWVLLYSSSSSVNGIWNFFAPVWTFAFEAPPDWHF